MSSIEYKIGDRVEAEVYNDDWRPATIIGRKLRGNGQVFYRISVKGIVSAPHLSARRLRAATSAERWTVMTEEGLTLFAEDIFTEEEARAFVAENPETMNGKKRIAVPESVGRKAMADYIRLGEESAAKLAQLRKDYALLTVHLAEKGIAV